MIKFPQEFFSCDKTDSFRVIRVKQEEKIMTPTPPEAGYSPPGCEAAEKCIIAIASGDKEALARLYEDTGAAVYGFALSILKNPDDAADVLQDVYVKVWEAAPAYRALGKPMAWIFTITRNLALMDIRRQNKAWPAVPDSAKEMAPDAPALDTEDKLVLTSLMNTLGEDEQSIVILHAVAGMKHREIAELMDMSLSTVLSKYNRALKKLRSALEET